MTTVFYVTVLDSGLHMHDDGTCHEEPEFFATYAQAVSVLHRYGVRNPSPMSIRRIDRAGVHEDTES